MQEDACIKKVNEWITKTKREVYETNIKSENSSELFAYTNELEMLESKLRKAITDENTNALFALGWPNELIECIKNMTLRVEILDCLQQAFTINHFNKSPKHEAELENESELRNETPL